MLRNQKYLNLMVALVDKSGDQISKLDSSSEEHER